MLKHFRYFGPRGELLWYTGLIVGSYWLIRNNINRENVIDSSLNDRNVFYRAELPAEMRKIK